jgi:hypothetical protein
VTRYTWERFCNETEGKSYGELYLIKSNHDHYLVHFDAWHSPRTPPHASSTLDISWAILNPTLSCQWTCTFRPTYWSMWAIAMIKSWTGTLYVVNVLSHLSQPCPSQTQHLNGLSLGFNGLIWHSQMSRSAMMELKLLLLASIMMARMKWLCGS